MSLAVRRTLMSLQFNKDRIEFNESDESGAIPDTCILEGH